MIKEYINELKAGNQEKLNDLEKQMKELLNDLDRATQWMESLQAEKNVDKNIFSPRAMDVELESKMEGAKNNIRNIKQNIEYVRSFIEESIAKEKEYDKLLDELKDMNNLPDSKEKLLPEKISTGEMPFGKRQISDRFLSDIYKKTELCLDLLYNDRSRCKNELKTMKVMIKNTMESLHESM